MADLIDRQALKAIYSGKRWHYLRNRINKLPTVDAVVLPCKIGEEWEDTNGEVFTVDGFHCDKWSGWSVLYHYDDGENRACNLIYFQAQYKRYRERREENAAD